MSECLGDFPLVDETKVTVLLKEYYLLDAKEDKEWQDIARRNKTSKEIESLVKDRIQWIINFVGTLPDGEWKAGTRADNDMFFAEVVAYQRLLHRIKDNNFDNLTGEISLCYISSKNFEFEYRTGYDDGYPEMDTIGFPKELILNNEQADIEEKILRLAVEKCNRMEYSFQKKFRDCVACSDRLGIICEKKGIKLS